MMQLDIQPRRKSSSAPESEKPFRLLLLGDFGADTPQPVVIDRDNFHQVLEKLKIHVELPAGRVDFKDIDDFRPEHLHRHFRLFRALEQARERLEDPGTFREVTQAPAPEAPAAILSSGSLLDQVTAVSEGKPAAAADPFQQWLKKVVAPYVAAKPDQKQVELVGRIEAAVGEEMRNLLHRPEFQELEAAWRAVFFLVRDVETGPDLKIYLYNYPRALMEEDLLAASDLKATRLYKILVEQTVRTPGAHPWAAIAGNYTFGSSARDAELLGRIALLAKAAGAPFLAGGTTDPAAWSETPVAWKELTTIPEASYVGLALPRFLLRLPYGKKTDEVEGLDFEEMPGAPVHEHYLWGNSAFLCAYLLAQTFRESGWAMQPGEILDLRNMPLHVWKQDGESVTTPCAEVWMRQETAEHLMEAGLMPVISMKDQDRVRLAGFRGINGKVLSGRWG
jgi:type VI secretion system protein ImpC